MRIRVVEDEATLGERLTSSIAEAGYAVDSASDGERAVSAYGGVQLVAHYQEPAPG
jgi:DNA-binding response OmpR family regulator